MQKLYPLEITDDQEDTEKDDVAGYSSGDQREDLSEQLQENTVKENSESLGSPGGASGVGIGQTEEDNIEQLLSNETKLKSKRTAAIDGQLRRRINDLKKM